MLLIVLLAIHLLAAVFWVGGMAFAYTVLRPSAAALDAAARLPLWGRVFAISSLLTPFFMGTVVGAIATGAVPADASHASLAAWTSPAALLTGFLFVVACGYLAAVYLVVEAGRHRGPRQR